MDLDEIDLDFPENIKEFRAIDDDLHSNEDYMDKTTFYGKSKEYKLDTSNRQETQDDNLLIPAQQIRLISDTDEPPF